MHEISKLIGKQLALAEMLGEICPEKKAWLSKMMCDLQDLQRGIKAAVANQATIEALTPLFSSARDQAKHVIDFIYEANLSRLFHLC